MGTTGGAAPTAATLAGALATTAGAGAATVNVEYAAPSNATATNDPAATSKLRFTD